MKTMQRHRGKVITLITAAMTLLMFHVWLPQSAEPSLLGMPLHFYYIVLYGILSVGSTALIFALVWPRNDPDIAEEPSEPRPKEVAR
jgi:hypothetical protein